MNMELLWEKLEEPGALPTQEFAECVLSIYKELKSENNQKIRHEVYEKIYRSIAKTNVYMGVYLYSVLVYLEFDTHVMEEFIEYVRKQDMLTYKNKYYLFYQIANMIFLHPELETEPVLTAKWRLLEQVKTEISQKLTKSLQKIPREQRDAEMVLVITEQFLGASHGPTKTALDRCVSLVNAMGKKVLLINTAELLTEVGKMPILFYYKGNYNKILSEQEFQSWKGVEIPYFQCDCTLPEVQIYEVLLQMVEQIKPMYVVNIGGSSVFAGLVDEMVPALTVGTTQSGLAVTLTSYQAVHGKLNDTWKLVCKNTGKTEQHMIHGRFTFSLKEQLEHTSREKEQLPDKQFLLAVVGARLDEEVTDDFLKMLRGVLSPQIGVVFIGKFETYEKVAERYPDIRQYMYQLGYCRDILSKLEICDLYVNPTRKGGGTSAVEAMSKGLPTISVSYGDVAGIIGEEFCCRDYEEMAELIGRYAKDDKFYQKKAEDAKKLAELYLDTDSEFKRIMEEYDRREAEV